VFSAFPHPLATTPVLSYSITDEQDQEERLAQAPESGKKAPGKTESAGKDF
jgi:hypothetical protein